jgi:hypothetical protein
MNDLTIAREVAKLLEPDETLRSEVHNREPVVYEPELLYVWVRSSTYSESDTGTSDRHNISLGAAWLTPSARVDDFEVDVSELIDDKVATIVDTVRSTRAYRSAGGTTYWEWLQVDEVDYTAPTTNDARGVDITLSGYVQEYS